MGTNQVLLEQPAPPRTASALETDYRVRDAVGIELLHSPCRNSVRHESMRKRTQEVMLLQLSRQEKDATRSSQGNSDLAVPLLPSVLPLDKPMTPNHVLLEADPPTVLQGHCSCKPITSRTAADEQRGER